MYTKPGVLPGVPKPLLPGPRVGWGGGGGAGGTKEFRHLCDNWIYVSDLAVLTIELLSVLTVER